MSNDNPFVSAPSAPAAPVMNSAPVAPTAAPAAPVAAPTAAPVGSDVKKPRKTPNRQMTTEERRYVIQNYATMNTSEIAQHLGLTRQQVYRTINESRKSLKTRLDGLQGQPQTPEVAAQVAKINELLASMPAKPFGGGGATGKRGSSVDNVLDDLLK